MLSLTRKTDYALVALAELSRLDPQQASAREIAEHCQVPPSMLTNILKELVSAGLVTSTRGAKGGHRLACSLDEVSLADLIEAIEGPVRLTLCCTCDSVESVDESTCDLEQSCTTREPMRKLNDMFHQFLEQVKLTHIITDSIPVDLGLSEVLGRENRQSVVTLK